jgi:putative FmdB family regulatory protein
MPSYDYRCKNCHKVFLVTASYDSTLISLEKEITCPECGSDNIIKLINKGVGVIFKGEGFYNTDNNKEDNENGK